MGKLVAQQDGPVEAASLNQSLLRFWRDEDGQDLVEYSLLLAFIALAAVALLGGIKTNIGAIWSKLNSSLVSADTAGQ